ncbi:MAG: hypothetical protein ACKVX7_14330 [Planctomycetota bacterium]
MGQRRSKMPKLGIQLKLGMIMLMCAVACTTVQFLFFLRSASDVAAAIPAARELLLGQLSALILKQYLTTLLLLVPLMVSVGILISFPIAGPIYRFEKYFREIAQGAEVQACTIRRGDNLQELCELINQAMARIQADNATGRSDPTSIPALAAHASASTPQPAQPPRINQQTPEATY